MKRKITMVAAILFVATFSCVNLEVPEKQAAAPQTTTELQPGTLSGFVIKDVDGYSPLTDREVTDDQPPDTEIVPGALVQVEGANLYAVTDDSGGFVMRGVPSGKVNLILTADLDDNGEDEYSLRLEGVDVPKDNGLHLGWIKLHEPGRIAGMVLLGGTPTGNLGIMVFIPGTSRIAMTDDEGNYVIDGIPEGTYDVAAKMEGYCTQMVEDIPVQSEETTRGVNMILPMCSDTGAIAGNASKMVDPDDSGIQVAVLGTTFATTTLSDGSWEISGIPAGVYQVQFSCNGYFTIVVDNVPVIKGMGAYIVKNVYLSISTDINVPDGYRVDVIAVSKDGERYNDIEFTPWGQLLISVGNESRVACDSYIAGVAEDGEIEGFAEICIDAPTFMGFSYLAGDKLYFLETAGYDDFLYSVPPYGSRYDVTRIAGGFILLSDMVTGPDGNFYIADVYQGKVFRAFPSGGAGLVAEGFTHDHSGYLGGNGTWLSLAFDPNGNLLVADASKHSIYLVNENGVFPLITEPSVNPGPIAVSTSGDYFVVNLASKNILWINPDGELAGVATGFKKIVSIELGPDGALYVLEWMSDTGWPMTRVVRISQTAAGE